MQRSLWIYLIAEIASQIGFCYTKSWLTTTAINTHLMWLNASDELCGLWISRFREWRNNYINRGLNLIITSYNIQYSHNYSWTLTFSLHKCCDFFHINFTLCLYRKKTLANQIKRWERLRRDALETKLGTWIIKLQCTKFQNSKRTFLLRILRNQNYKLYRSSYFRNEAAGKRPLLITICKFFLHFPNREL